MNGGRGTTTLATHKTQIHLNIFSHNGFCLFSPLKCWVGDPTTAGLCFGKGSDGERRTKSLGGKEGNAAPLGGERKTLGEGRAEPGEPEGTAGGRWGSEWPWLLPGSPWGAEGRLRAALTSPLVMLIAK